MELSERQEKVLDFVKLKHEGQVRKYTGEPYWTHPYEVAELVSIYIDDAIEIALLHDVLEDTDCSNGELITSLISFGYSSDEAMDICSGVIDLTDVYTTEAYPNINRAGRKKLESRRLGTISSKHQTIKYADLIHNSSSIVKHGGDFAAIYLSEKMDMIEQMRGGEIKLMVKCCSVLETSLQKSNNKVHKFNMKKILVFIIKAIGWTLLIQLTAIAAVEIHRYF